MFLRAFGRLRPGVDNETARADLNAVTGELAQAAPERWTGRTIEVAAFHRGLVKHDDFSVLWFMLLAASFVLVIACANVANLLLARSTARGRELAVRSALGASRRRLIAQMLAESLALCLAGGGIGVLLTAWAADTVNGWFAAAELPYWIRVQVDMRAIGIVLALIGLCACVAGVIPALRASRTDLLELLKESGRTSTGMQLGWFGRTVIGVQVAMAFALLVLAGMMIRSIQSLRDVDVPYRPSEILSARFGLFEQETEPRQARSSFLEQLTAGLASDPRVLAAAVTTRMRFEPASVVSATREDPARDDGASAKLALVESVSPGYFQTLEAAVHRGRDFTSDDVTLEQDVAIVNESFVRLVFPDAEPIGAQVRIRGGEKDTEVRTIVGVVRDMQMNGVKGGERAGLYLPIRPSRDRFFTVLARVRGDARLAEPVLRRVIRQLDANLPLYWVQSYEEAMDTAIHPFTVVRTVFLVFGASAVLLAGVGIYGVVSFTVNQRTPEIGIRMALGARAATILGIVVRQGAVQMLVGMVAGGFLVFSMMGLVRRFEVFVNMRDPALFVLVGVLLSVVVLAASLLPARRAAHLTPLAAMRHE